jgi:hypothetical protein
MESGVIVVWAAAATVEKLEGPELLNDTRVGGTRKRRTLRPWEWS